MPKIHGRCTSPCPSTATGCRSATTSTTAWIRRRPLSWDHGAAGAATRCTVVDPKLSRHTVAPSRRRTRGTGSEGWNRGRGIGEGESRAGMKSRATIRREGGRRRERGPQRAAP
ncbi:hypothetical protein BRADI_1g45015v3 [Brachypodium distachyon]|uniref:Uncharacterized protein n=1 Tax=Brachypodium distachyon TaxID=15368 RepID=A0A0Q3H759_BRADI|nr:hypothetical protein BRADI_1g45015v3 [Brachypodium distachyon]